MKDKLPVEIKQNEMPINKIRNQNFDYNNRKVSSLGFVDTIFLISLILTSAVWGMILVLLGAK